MTTKIKLSLFMTISLIMTTHISFGQCEGKQNEFDAIKQRYESRYKLIEQKANNIKDDAPNPDNPVETTVNVDFDIDMKEQHFALDVISITMKDKKLSLNLPQVTMESKSIKFDEVYTKMVLKKTGQYPEIHCEDTWIYGPFGSKTKGVPKCKTVWKDIKTEVPEIHTRTIEIKTNLPVMTMKTTEFVTAIPEFKMTRQDIKMNLPSITIKNISAQTKKMEQETDELKNQSQELVGEQKKEFGIAIANNFNCQRENLVTKRTEVIQSFANSIKEIDQNINQLVANGFDPSNIKSSDGQTFNLVDLKKQLTEKEKLAIANIDKAIEELNTKEKEVINQFFAE